MLKERKKKKWMEDQSIIIFCIKKNIYLVFLKLEFNLIIFFLIHVDLLIL